MDVYQSLLLRLANTFKKPNACLLCRQPLGGQPTFMCPPCAAELPRITAACQRCGLPLPQSAPRCGDCLNDPPVFETCQTLFRYQHPLDYLITRFKQDSHCSVTQWLMNEVQTCQLQQSEKEWDAIVPVPLHWRKLWQRGFNQSLIIGEALAQREGCPIHPLRRRTHTVAQKSLSRSDRALHLAGVFYSARPIEGLNLLIVDDVVTTGATANAIAKTLYDQGAARVGVFALARTPKA